MIIAYDVDDKDALARRLKVRSAHLRQAAIMKEKGYLIEAGAILNDEGQIIGSTLLCRFDSRTELDQWINHVWVKVEIKPIKLVKF
ncbi:YciI family protein [Catalinimonas niigatensis]|uniref:YciI family protein n=1 Tax=Catalinimonas niigatensis TaxID=1397264 RepID=UPI002666293A|nr:YciI family protein [Catalinimonas niigatensis]WPP48427.1 YciI family protein [Catalinimonas niigatensis]